MNRLMSSKPVDNTKLKFKPMGSKPGISKAMPAKKKTAKKKTKTNPFAKKAAMAMLEQ